jgi:NAD(P)H-dependent FMN reductase
MAEILLLCGSVREGSSNETMLRTVADVVAERRDGTSAVRYQGLGSLPHFNPDLDADPLPKEVADLRAAIASADALLICAPEYAGTLPGSFKNLLDWTVGGTETSGKPAAWINAAGPGRGGGAVATLRTVLEYTGATVVDEACLALPFDRAKHPVADGVVTDPEARARLAGAVGLLLAAAASVD